MLQGLLEKQPTRRLDWPQLLDHPFVRDSENDMLSERAASSQQPAAACEQKRPASNASRAQETPIGKQQQASGATQCHPLGQLVLHTSVWKQETGSLHQCICFTSACRINL